MNVRALSIVPTINGEFEKYLVLPAIFLLCPVVMNNVHFQSVIMRKETKVGLKTIGLPDEELDNMQIEEDFERLCNNISNDINEIPAEEPNAVDINEIEEEEEELGETNVLVVELENQEESVPPTYICPAH
ncbi:hypothetical protein QE152_g37418 [Popillia japonica]|uniref:Uncharacterized protein n=1 Tax=Popillia japonica TaxID=7064 RepID=A0AAW1I9Q3_POPJA